MGSRPIILSQGLFAIVDDSDYPLLSEFKWCAHRERNGRIYAWRYLRVGGKQTYVKMHRQIMNAPASADVDHINTDGLDNRRSNLRIVSRSQNNMNKIKTWAGSSSYRGVSWNKRRNHWVSQIKQDGKGHYIGSFRSEIDAAKAYDQEATKRFGKLAVTNFGEEANNG